MELTGIFVLLAPLFIILGGGFLMVISVWSVDKIGKLINTLIRSMNRKWWF